MARRRHFGSVRRLSSGRWQARYWDAAGGRAGAPTTFATKDDAQRWLSAAETDIGRGDWHDPRLGEIPFRDWADRWLATKSPTLGESTAELYPYMLRRHIVPRFGAMAVGRITVVDVQAWLADLHRTKLSVNSVAKAYRVLNGVMDPAVDARLIDRTVALSDQGSGHGTREGETDRHPSAGGRPGRRRRAGRGGKPS